MTDFNTNPVNETPETPAADPLDRFVEHQRKAVEEGIKAVDALLPEGFKTHGREAGREFAKGMKILVDAAIEGLESASKELDKNFRKATQPSAATPDSDYPSSTGPTKVKVQVE